MICAKAAAALRGALERGSVRKGSLCGCAGGKGGLCTSNCGSERCTGRGVSAEAAAAPRGALEGGPVQNVHWEGRIDVDGGKGRRVDFVCEEATTLCGKWQLLPESSGRWFGAQLLHRALANEVRAS